MKTTYEFNGTGIELHLGDLVLHEADALVLPHNYFGNPAFSELSPRMNPLEVRLLKSGAHHPKDIIFVSHGDISEEEKSKSAIEAAVKNALQEARTAGYSSLAIPLLRTKPFQNPRSMNPKFSTPGVVEAMTNGLTNHFQKKSPIKKVLLVVEKSFHFSAADKVMEERFPRVYRANGKNFYN